MNRFLLSVPSYIIPGTYLSNVAFLDRFTYIQAVELLLYYYNGETRLLLQNELEGLRSYRERFSFAVHMPDILQESHREIVELTRDFAQRYVLHPPPGGEPEFVELAGSWRAEFGDIFLLENLIDRSFERLAAELEDMPLCCDTGHLLLNGSRVEPFLEAYGTRIREIHLHGALDGRDHLPFKTEEYWFRELLPFLRRFKGVLNLEVFSLADMEAILDTLIAAGLIDPACR